MVSLRSLPARIRSVLRRRRSRERRVAIVCQGGGSHAAFTAGVLSALFDDLPDGYRVVALSGTSGGAVCAAAAWYGHLAPTETPAGVLESLWTDIAASSGWERWVNQLTLLKTRLGSLSSGAGPYSSAGRDWGRSQLEAVLCQHIDFDAFAALRSDDGPSLFVSAVDVKSGDPAVFRAPDVTVESIVASAAVPHLFDPVEIDGRYYWDGFLSQNPPMWDVVVDPSTPPVDELWVVQLTPRRVDGVPTTDGDVYDRSQQLVENLSLTQERRFLETVNGWITAGKLVDDSLTETTVRTIELHHEQTERSRLDRRSTFIDDLYADGTAEASNFLRELPEA